MAKKNENKSKEYKHTVRPEEDKKVIKARLHRIEGQIKGILKMVDEDRYCDDILIQLSATDKSVKSLANLLIERHLISNIQPNLKNEDEKTIQELITFFKRFQ